MPALKWNRKKSLQHRIIGLVLIVILLILIIVGYLFNLIIVKSVEDSVGKNALSVAKLIAEMPDIRESFDLPDPSAYLQPRTQALREETQADFITVLNSSGIRYTHNNLDQIGKPFTGGDEGLALLGKEYISTAVGISGPSIRAFVPIKKENKVIGVICVGMFVNNIYKIVGTYISSIIYRLSIGMAIGIALSILLAKSIKKTLYGLEPDEIASLLKERETLLDCLHEGVLAVDQNKNISWVNESARRLLSVQEDIVGKPLTDVIPISRLGKIIDTKNKEYNIETTINDVTLIVNRVPILVNSEVTGAVATFRDITEVRSLAEELTGVKQYMEGLRAKTHEFMNRLHTVHGLVELQEYEEAKSFILQTTKSQQRLMYFLSRKIRDAKTSALLLGKIQQAEERNIILKIDPGSQIYSLPAETSNSMVSILGNLIDNAFDAVEDNPDAEIIVTLLEKVDQWMILVEDNGHGISQEQIPRIFEKHYSTKADDRGYGLYLVKSQLDHVLNGQIEVSSASDQGTTFFISIPKEVCVSK